MFKNTFQSGLLSIFYSCGSNPLGLWEMDVKNGHIKRVTDTEVNSIVLEIVSTNVATTFITCPKRNQVLGIKLPFLVMIVKNLKRYFTFEITILDDKNMRRRFRISNFQSSTKILPFCTSMPIGLASGWNQIQFNLSDFTKRAYGTQFLETLRVQVNANARLRRIYFSDRLYSEDELPQEYKLYLPFERKLKKAIPNKKAPTETKEVATIPQPEPLVEPAVELIPEVKKAEPQRKTSMVATATEVDEESKPANVTAASEAVTDEAEKVADEEKANETVPEQSEVTDNAPTAEGEATPIEEPGTETPVAETPVDEAPAAETPVDEPAPE